MPVEIITYVALISGALLIVLLLLSILGGVDIDVDIDLGDADTDAGIGLFKGLLTFLSVGGGLIKGAIEADVNPLMSLLVGAAGGLLAVWLLSLLFKALLRGEEEVNWHPVDALHNTATVYLRIPVEGTGIIKTEIKGAIRELRAVTREKEEIPTGAQVEIIRVLDDLVEVRLPIIE